MNTDWDLFTPQNIPRRQTLTLRDESKKLSVLTRKLMLLSVVPGRASAIFNLEYPQSVVVVDDYATAQKIVDQLSE